MATQLSVEQSQQSPRAPAEIEVPASTAWPLVLAFGFTLMFAGLLTSVSVSVLGVVLAEAGVLDEAERELQKLLDANPKSPIARSLLRSVKALRR